MEMAQQKRGESILYIFSAIEQSPRSADRQTPQRDGERQKWREGEGREGVLECSAPRERAALDGVVVHLRVCICGECGEPPPRPGLGPHSARSLWLRSLERVIPGGDTTPGVSA